MRLRRHKANVALANPYESLKRAFTGPLQADELSKEWAKSEYRKLNRVLGKVKSAAREIETSMAHFFIVNLDSIERIDRLMIQAEARRDGVLREIDRRRSAVASQLRLITRQIEDAEFEVVGEGETSHTIAPDETPNDEHSKEHN